MTSLIYFLLLAGLFAFMMRSGCGSHVMGHRHGGARTDGQASPDRPEKETDPVCGMTVDTATAKTSVYQGRTYYFCSAQCRDRFEASPATFLNAPKTLAMKDDAHAAHTH